MIRFCDFKLTGAPPLLGRRGKRDIQDFQAEQTAEADRGRIFAFRGDFWFSERPRQLSRGVRLRIVICRGTLLHRLGRR